MLDGRCFFFNDTATTEIYTLSLHDALPICVLGVPKDTVGRDPLGPVSFDGPIAEHVAANLGQIGRAHV